MDQCIHDIYKIINNSYFNIQNTNYNYNLNKINNHKFEEKNLYIPEKIITWINKYTKYIYNYILYINKRKIIINIYSNKYIKDINNYFFKIELLFYILTNYSNINCSKNINLKIYLTPFKKLWDGTENIDIFNVNTGISTIGCINYSSILLYRKEEWYKVLIHEVMHNLNLDFANIYREKYKLILKENFFINSKYDLTETYSEFWARQLNLMIFSYLNIEKKEIFKLFYNYYKIILNKEIIFSLQQANKLSKIIYLSNYKEKTNVFCYYILTSVLMFYSKDFIIWCKNNNTNLINFKKNSNNILKFINFIIDKYYSLDYYKNLEKFTKNYKSMRMTIIF